MTYKSDKVTVNECAYCRRVSIISLHFQTYVCDDCYDLDFDGRMKVVADRKEKEIEGNE